MTVTADDIAALVQKHYDALPAKRKPAIRGNGLREWVPLAGIVAEGRNNESWCLALATGMKCLPASKLPQAQGNVLHDWHAEVLAIRAFNRFVLDECHAVVNGPGSEFLRWRTPEEIAAGTYTDSCQSGEGRDEVGNGEEKGGDRGKGELWHGQPFTWREDIRLHMYCSEAPCGDASMELIMASQEDATPWDVPELTPITPAPDTSPASPIHTSSSTPTPTHPAVSSLPGRAYFSQLGVVRRKPARPDAQPTLSKSCSDKLALRQIISLLNSTTTLLVDPSQVYLHTLILPASRYCESACRRAFSCSGPDGRMSSLATYSGGGGYAFYPFTLATTTSEFVFSQRSVALAASKPTTPTPTTSISNENNTQQPKTTGIAPSNVAVTWTRSGQEETTLGGTQQGRKQFDPRGASCASRRKLWSRAATVANLLEEGGSDGKIRGALNLGTYGKVKDSILLEPRRRAKERARAEALKGWIRNLGDEEFSLEDVDR
ncbi:adenosine deaminase/editase [Hypoxylon crocopeplum]|nr:adenosine deaminase/editase [Hypoxylon crocopeplum]